MLRGRTNELLDCKFKGIEPSSNGKGLKVKNDTPQLKSYQTHEALEKAMATREAQKEWAPKYSYAPPCPPSTPFESTACQQGKIFLDCWP
jgi:hypothetical protein